MKVYCASELYDGTGAIKKEYAICVENGRITKVGPAGELCAACGCEPAEEFPHHIMLPAFTDAHDHGRGISPAAFGAVDDALELWIPTLCRVGAPAAEAAFYDGLLLASSGVGAVAHCHNYTSLDDPEREIVDTVRAYIRAGVKVAMYVPYVDENNTIYHDRAAFEASLEEPLKREFARRVMDSFYTLDEYFGLMDKLRLSLKPELDSGKAALGMQPVGAQWCGDRALTAMKEYALKNGMRIHIHLLETKYQMLYAKKRFGCTMAEHFRDIGFLGPWLTCAHNVWLTDSDMDILSEAGVKCVVNPSSNLRLRSGQARLGRLIEKGLSVGIGLDGCGFDDDEDYLREMRAALLNPYETGVNAKLWPKDIMELATTGGAATAGGTLSSGLLKAGVPADFLLVDIDKLKAPWCFDGADSLELILRRGTRGCVSAVYSDGVLTAKDGAPALGGLKSAACALREGVISMQDGGAADISDALLQRIKDFYTAWEAEL